MMTTPKYDLHYFLSSDDRLRSALGQLDDARLDAVLVLVRDECAARAARSDADDGWDDAGRWELGARPAAAVYASDQAYRAEIDLFANGDPS